jgi:glycerol-3-phosphate dehydrogenase
MKLSHSLIAFAALATTLAAQKKGAPADFAQDLQQNYTAGKTKILAAATDFPSTSPTEMRTRQTKLRYSSQKEQVVSPSREQVASPSRSVS